MRINAGKFGGRILIENKFEHIRPTADMVKQAVFNKLGSRVFGAKVLDLCCGTGALGIEAISRGAREVVFVDKDKRSVNLTKQNLDLVKVQAQILQIDALKCCQVLQNQKFDIILFDPPYKSDLYASVPPKVAQFGLLSNDGIFVIEHAKEDSFVWPEQFEVLDQKRYGIKQVTYLCLKNQPE